MGKNGTNANKFNGLCSKLPHVVVWLMVRVHNISVIVVCMSKFNTFNSSKHLSNGIT